LLKICFNYNPLIIGWGMKFKYSMLFLCIIWLKSNKQKENICNYGTLSHVFCWNFALTLYTPLQQYRIYYVERHNGEIFVFESWYFTTIAIYHCKWILLRGKHIFFTKCRQNTIYSPFLSNLGFSCIWVITIFSHDGLKL
jgi:hypothetical protein